MRSVWEVCIGRIEARVMAADRPVEVVMDDKAVALLDANNSFGQVAGHMAMLTAMGKAKEYGCSLRSSTIGSGEHPSSRNNY